MTSGAATPTDPRLLAGWRRRESFVVLQTRFGSGHNFLALWNAWRQDPERSARLHVIAIEPSPPTREALAQAHRASLLAALAQELVQAWPPLTPNLHRLSLDAGRVQLLLAIGEAMRCLPEIVAEVDGFDIDPSRLTPEPWPPRLFKALGRLAAPDATLVARSAARALRDGLSAAGFVVHSEGSAGEITLATFAPKFKPKRPPARAVGRVAAERHALIVGAGLAGCASAWALAEQGWSSTVFDSLPGVAEAASGNPAGLFHGIFNRQDGVHARFNRAAALEAQRAVRIAIDEHGVAGQLAGVLRLEGGHSVEAMRAQIEALGLPADFVQALSAGEVRNVSGLALDGPAWFYPGGGWVDPAGLAASFIRRAGAMTRFQGGTRIASLRRAGEQWQLLDAHGQVLAQAAVVVLANALDAQRLLIAAHWPLHSVRGQTTLLPAAGLPLPRVPITGAGYLLPALPGETAMCGATSQRDDPDVAVRDQDHRDNIARLLRLTGSVPHVDPATLQGRVGWRCVADDRLPVIGAVPDGQALRRPGLRLDHARFVPRSPGLFVFTALASRGITWAALGAQTLSSLVSGAPCPLEASLFDAVDAARFDSRAARRG